MGNDLTRTKKVIPTFNAEFATIFKPLNDVVIFSEQRRVYIRLCRSAKDIENMKVRLKDLVKSQNQGEITYLDEGFHDTLNEHFLVYT